MTSYITNAYTELKLTMLSNSKVAVLMGGKW